MQNLSNEKNSFSEGQIWKIIYNISLGLSEIHGNKTAHRDICPENILTTIDGFYKICDFKSVTNKFYETVTNYTRNEIIFDISRNTSLSVRAPEQSDLYTGYPINEKVDIWALGILLYRLLFESAPFFRDYNMIMKTFSNDTIELSEEMSEYYSPDILTILKQMLRSHPGQRISCQQIIKFIESKKDSLFGQKVSNLKKRTFSITNSVNDATVKMFKRHSTIFWVIKLTQEDLTTYPKLKYIKFLVNKAWTKKFKVYKLFQAISTRPIHYCSYVALKTMYIIHSYIFLGPKEVLIPQNFNIQDFLCFFSNIWYSRYSSANYDKDEVLKNAHVTKFIISYSDYIKSKIIFHLKYSYIENNYSIENLITKDDFDFSLLLDKTFISDILSLYSLVYQKLMQVPICLNNIAKTIDVILQILNEDLLSLFNFIFFLLVGYKNFTCNSPANNMKLFDSHFLEITNKARDYLEKLKKYRQEIDSKNIFLEFPGDSLNLNIFSDYLNALDENLKFFPKKDFNIKEFFSVKDIIGIKLSTSIGNMIESSTFFNKLENIEISRSSIISNLNINGKDEGSSSPKSVSLLNKRVSEALIDNKKMENSNKNNFEFSEEKFLNSKMKFDFETGSNPKTNPFGYQLNNNNQSGQNPLEVSKNPRNSKDFIDSPPKNDKNYANNIQSLFNQNFFSRTYNNQNEKPNESNVESKNSEESLNNLNSNVLDVLNEIFESNKVVQAGSIKNQENNEKNTNNLLIDMNVNPSSKVNLPIKETRKNEFTGNNVNNNNYYYNNQDQLQNNPQMKNKALNNVYPYNGHVYNNQINPMLNSNISNLSKPFNNNNFNPQQNYLRGVQNAYNGNIPPFDMFQNAYPNYNMQTPYMQGYRNYNNQGMNFNYASNSNLNYFSNNAQPANLNMLGQGNLNHQIGNNISQNNAMNQNQITNPNLHIKNPVNKINEKEEFESVSSQFPQMSIINIQNNFNDIKVFKEVNIETLANDFLKEEFSKKNLQWLISSKDVNYGKQIGFGGSSEVFRADYRGTEVAVKKLRILEVKEENLKEFKREVSSLIMLRHPNLVLFMGAM
jgi:serine/threonine protein kinase